jgi:hypothetical protein
VKCRAGGTDVEDCPRESKHRVDIACSKPNRQTFELEMMTVTKNIERNSLVVLEAVGSELPTALRA